MDVAEREADLEDERRFNNASAADAEMARAAGLKTAVVEFLAEESSRISDRSVRLCVCVGVFG